MSPQRVRWGVGLWRSHCNGNPSTRRNPRETNCLFGSYRQIEQSGVLPRILTGHSAGDSTENQDICCQNHTRRWALVCSVVRRWNAAEDVNVLPSPDQVADTGVGDAEGNSYRVGRCRHHGSHWISLWPVVSGEQDAGGEAEQRCDGNGTQHRRSAGEPKVPPRSIQIFVGCTGSTGHHRRAPSHRTKKL